MKQLTKWINYRKSMFTPSELQLILKGMNEYRFQSFRINKMKLKEPKIPWKISKLEWSNNAFYIKEKVSLKQIQKTSLFKNSEILLQSLSSMLPVIVLNPQSNERVLDMCASPGSKTMQILETGASVVAIEIDQKRYSKLSLNVKKTVPERLQSKIELIRSDGRFLNLPLFDKILLDAPCSGEGIFCTKEPWTIHYWSPTLVTYCSKLQKELLHNAFNLLKPGGELVYSTCTIGTEENADNVNWFLSNYSVILDNIDIDLVGANIKREMDGTLKILPNSKYQGFFIAKFTKL